MNASFTLQFGYCLLVRNFHNRSLNDRIKRLQEEALCLVYKGTNSSIVELLEKENTFTINQKNIKKRALEIYKEKHKIAPKLKCELFQETETHIIYGIIIHSEHTMLKLCNMGQKYCYLWDLKYRLSPSNIKNSEALEIFKQKVSYWKPENFPCRLFKTYIKGLGYL